MRLFMLTLCKYMADNRRSLLLTLAGLVALMIFIGTIYAWDGMDRSDLQFFSVAMYLGIFACVKTSTMFGSMKTPRGRIQTLMTPATSLDKFASAWFVNIFLAGIIYVGAYWLCDAVKIAAWPIFNDDPAPEWCGLPDMFDPYPYRMLALTVTSILANQAFFCFGAIAWPRLSAIKSMLVLWVLCIIFASVILHLRWNVIGQSADTITTAIVAFNTVVTLILWGLAYMRFSESDVADRLI